MKIIIEAVADESEMRYPSLGDWFTNDDGDLVIRVVGEDPFTDDQAFLIALHELVEAKLCKARAVTQAAVDEFDMAFEGEGEPGDAVDSPYRQQHRFAMILEHLMAHELGFTGYGVVE